MRENAILLVAVIFIFSATVTFAGGIDKPGCSSGKLKCRTVSVSGEDGLFNKASRNIDTWDRTAPEARKKSLRENKCELKRRRKADSFMLF